MSDGECTFCSEHGNWCRCNSAEEESQKPLPQSNQKVISLSQEKQKVEEIVSILRDAYDGDPRPVPNKFQKHTP